MYKQWIRFVGLAMASMLVVACGGGGGGGGGSLPVGPTASASLTGYAATGAPMRGALVTLTDGTRTQTTTTDNTGRYSFSNTANLVFPLTLTATEAGGRGPVTLHGIVFSGQLVSNITPVSEALFQVLGANLTAAEVVRVSRLIQTSLNNYQFSVASLNYISDPAFRPSSTGLDAVLDLVSFVPGTNSIRLISKAKPDVSVTVDTTQGAATPTQLPRPTDSETVSPVDLASLINDFETLFRNSTINATPLSTVLHNDFKDDNGLQSVDFAQQYRTASNVRFEGYEILRCNPDTLTVFDQCAVRIRVTRPVETFTEDFNNSGFTQVLGQENYDLVVERRGAQSSALKFSGGLYKPFAGSLRNIYRNVQTVGVNGVPITNNVIETGLAFIAPTSQATFGLSPAQLANSNVQTASLIRSNINGVTNLFSVERVATGDCGTKTSNLVINTGTYGAQGTDCGPVTTSLVTSNLFELSRTGELFMQFVESAGGAPVTSTSQPVRIQPFRSTTLAGDFPALDQVSLANLRTFTNSTTLQQVAVTLVVPTGKQKVCITTELDGVPICVRATRQVNLSVDQLSKAPVYLVTAEDSAGNLYQRRYLLN